MLKLWRKENKALQRMTGKTTQPTLMSLQDLPQKFKYEKDSLSIVQHGW